MGFIFDWEPGYYQKQKEPVLNLRLLNNLSFYMLYQYKVDGKGHVFFVTVDSKHVGNSCSEQALNKHLPSGCY